MKKIEFQDYPSTETPLNAENLNQIQSNIEEAFGAVDYTSQCAFVNCTLKSGGIYKIGKIVFVQICITASTTKGWAEIIHIPNDLHPLIISDNGTHIAGSEFWVYGDKTVKGKIENGNVYTIAGVYLANN